jgi:hypothetical protein
MPMFDAADGMSLCLCVMSDNKDFFRIFSVLFGVISRRY